MKWVFRSLRAFRRLCIEVLIWEVVISEFGEVVISEFGVMLSSVHCALCIVQFPLPAPRFSAPIFPLGAGATRGLPGLGLRV